MAWIGGLIGGALSLFGGSQQADAASNAAQVQGDSSAAAVAESRRQFDLARQTQQDQYNQARTDQQPFRDTGVAGNARLRQLLGLDAGYSGGDSGSLTRRFSASDLQADPVYQSGLQFGLDRGTAGINARAIAGGNYDSGATLKALTQFGNDYGSTKAADSYSRYIGDQSNIYNRLAGVSGAGQTATNAVNAAGSNAANQITAAGANSSNNIGNLITGAGNAAAAGIVGGANAWGGALGGANNAINSYQNNQNFQQLMARYPTYGNGAASNAGYQPMQEYGY